MKQVKQGLQSADLAMLVVLEKSGIAAVDIIALVRCVAAVKKIESYLVEEQIGSQEIQQNDMVF